MSIAELPPAETLDDVLHQVAEREIRERGLPPLYEQAMSDGWIVWHYPNLDSIGWLRLSDKGLAYLDLPPYPPAGDELIRSWLGTKAKALMRFVRLS